MRSIVLYLEGFMAPPRPMAPVALPPQQVPQRLSPILVNYMKKDPAFTDEVKKNLINYENMAKMRMRHLIK
jgi:hypothetical protein